MTIQQLYDWFIDCDIPLDYELDGYFIKDDEYFNPIMKGKIERPALKVDEKKKVVLYIR